MFMRLVSVVFHPVFVNVAALMLLMYIHPVLHVKLSTTQQLFYILFYFLMAAVIPLLTVLIMRLSGFVKSVYLGESSERRLPLMITSAMLVFLFYTFGRLNAPVSIQLFVLTNAAIAVSLMIWNEYNKISLHMASMGLVCGVLITFSFVFEVRWMLALFFPIAGITATSRLYNQAHTGRQLLYGFLLGLCSTLFIL
ncbi:MAG: hypothetical protein ACK45I_04685 [Bacteroidota bacterium]|jgi:uncharacterized membrane protein